MRTRAIIAGLLILVGLVWMGQGTNVIPGTGFMNGDMRWAWIGLVAFAFGVGLGVSAVIARRRT